MCSLKNLKVKGRQGVGSKERQVEHFFNLFSLQNVV